MSFRRDIPNYKTIIFQCQVVLETFLKSLLGESSATMVNDVYYAEQWLEQYTFYNAPPKKTLLMFLCEEGIEVEDFMQYIEPLFELPDEIRKAIYTTNVVESVNSALRKVTNGKGAFPSEDSVYKVLFLRIKDLKEKWNKPIRNWSIVQLQLINIFGDKYTQYIEL